MNAKDPSNILVYAGGSIASDTLNNHLFCCPEETKDQWQNVFVLPVRPLVSVKTSTFLPLQIKFSLTSIYTYGAKVNTFKWSKPRRHFFIREIKHTDKENYWVIFFTVSVGSP